MTRLAPLLALLLACDLGTVHLQATDALEQDGRARPDWTLYHADRLSAEVTRLTFFTLWDTTDPCWEVEITSEGIYENFQEAVASGPADWPLCLGNTTSGPCYVPQRYYYGTSDGVYRAYLWNPPDLAEVPLGGLPVRRKAGAPAGCELEGTEVHPYWVEGSNAAGYIVWAAGWPHCSPGQPCGASPGDWDWHNQRCSGWHVDGSDPCDVMKVGPHGGVE